MPAGAAVGSLVGLAAAGLSPVNRAQRRALRGDIEKMEAGQLGLSAAERQQMVGEATRAASVQQQMQNAALQQMVAQNPAMAGKALAAQGQVAESGALAGSQAAQQANLLSTQLAEARRASILDRMNRQAQQNSASGQQIGGLAGQTAAQAVGMGLGGASTYYGTMAPQWLKTAQGAYGAGG